jgi:hypothetical protein
MFDRIRKALAREPRDKDSRTAPPSRLPHGPVSEWAASQGFAMSVTGNGQAIAVEGRVGAKPWRMELGKPMRGFIRGEELRARAELGLPEDLAVMIMNRPLKEALEKKAYSIITDTLQTTADPNFPEEMRWLAMYDEVGWPSLPGSFWNRYAVLADRREHALAWIDPALAQLMMDWPEPAPSPEVPFILVLMRSKAYLRMEYRPAEMSTLQHAAQVFTSACESAVGGLSDDIRL